MSDNYIRFIPEELNDRLDLQETLKIKSLDSYGRITVNESEKIEFADAGSNFESVSCPCCGAQLMEWWGEAMEAAWDGQGFISLNITTPCCGKEMSLHNLNYYFNQGFYKVMVELEPEILKPLLWDEIAESIKQELIQITGYEWRIVYAHY